MTIEEIKSALENGLAVHWSNAAYVVLLDANLKSGLAVKCTHNGYYTGFQAGDLNDCYLASELPAGFAVRHDWMENRYTLLRNRSVIWSEFCSHAAARQCARDMEEAPAIPADYDIQLNQQGMFSLYEHGSCIADSFHRYSDAVKVAIDLSRNL